MRSSNCALLCWRVLGSTPVVLGSFLICCTREDVQLTGSLGRGFALGLCHAHAHMNVKCDPYLRPKEKPLGSDEYL